MKQSTQRILFSALAVIFVLSACVPAQVETPDPDEIANQIATSVALTVASQNLETEQAAPVATNTSVPTETPAVIDTPTAVLPTATPFVIVPATSVPGGGGGGVSVQPDYACDAINRRPRDYEVFHPGDEFDVRWTIVNTGRRTMAAGLDLKYSIGAQFIGVDRVELPQLDPGEEYTIDFDAVAPNQPGNYIMTYIVEGALCYPYTAITVERP
jgi:hypothetical protein